MLSMSMTRTRKAEKDKKTNEIAIKRALARKKARELARAHPEAVTDEEDLDDAEAAKPSEFFDVCNENGAK